MAHGELVLVAAYMAFVVESNFGPNPYASIPLALIVVAGLSAGVFALIDRIRNHRELNSLILTYAVGIILSNALLVMFGGDVRSTASPALQDAVTLGPVFAMKGEIVAFLISVVLMIALWWWLKTSWYGCAVRAVSSNRAAAVLMGISPRRTELAAFLVAGALASFAGVALFGMNVIQPSFGHVLTVKAFIVTVLAGVGSILGVFLAALLLGIVPRILRQLDSGRRPEQLPRLQASAHASDIAIGLCHHAE
jgi:branched-chain amino acid transport system permease protein